MRIGRRMLILGSLAAASRPIRAAAKSLQQPDPALLAPPTGIDAGEGFATGPNGRVFHRRFGTGAHLPVVVLHGGPAGGLGYMMPYAHLARDRITVLYDQSGCGRSDAPADLSRYTLDRYVDELEAVRAHLGFARMLLVGHSWGGLLAPAYAARHPDRVAGLVIAGSSPTWRGFQDAADRWLAALGPAAMATVRQAEASGNTDDPAYRALTERYYAAHLCRLDPWPAMFIEASEALGRNPVYPYLNGPTEFQFTGAFRNLDVSAALRQIRVPMLVTCGEYDEAPPWIAERYRGLVPHVRIESFAGLSHMSHIEDPARVIGTTRRFLASIG